MATLKFKPFEVGGKKYRGVPIDEERHKRYLAAGIIFENIGGCDEGRYDQVNFGVGNPDSVNRLAALSIDDLDRLESLLSEHKNNLDVRALLDEIGQAKLRIQEQGPNPKDSSPNRFRQERPFTWGLNGGIGDEILRLDKILNPDSSSPDDNKKQGITTKAGMEFEFFLPEQPFKGYEKNLADIRQRIIEELEQRKKQAIGKDINELDNKIKQVRKFSAREVLMAYLIELNPQTKELLEPLFGTTRDGNGYYDSEGVLELKIAKMDVKDVQKNRSVILNQLYETANLLGLVLERPPTSHISFSFWKGEQNLMDVSHPEFETTGKHIIEGVTRALYDALPAIAPNVLRPDLIPEHLREKEDNFGMSVNRMSYLRMASGRFEVRLAWLMDLAYYQHPEIILPIAMAGAAYGLSSHETDYFRDNVLKAEKVRNGTFHHTPNKFKIISHTLSGSIITPDNKLIVPEVYLLHSARKIGDELGLREKGDRVLGEIKGTPPSYIIKLQEFFNNITVEEIANDSETEDKKSYKINWPDVRGINTKPLEKSITLHDIVEKLVVEPGYDLKGEAIAGQPLTTDAQRAPFLQRLENSVPLGSDPPGLLSQGFREQLIQAMQDAARDPASLSEAQAVSTSAKTIGGVTT